MPPAPAPTHPLPRKAPSRPRRWTVPATIVAAGCAAVVYFIATQCNGDVQKVLSDADQGCAAPSSSRADDDSGGDGDSAFSSDDSSNQASTQPDCPLPDDFRLHQSLSRGWYFDNDGVPYSEAFSARLPVIDKDNVTIVVICDSGAGDGESTWVAPLGAATTTTTVVPKGEEKVWVRADWVLGEP